MTFNPVAIAWVIFGLIVLRMGLRMLDGGAEPIHFALMGAGGMVIAGLIMISGRLYNRHVRRRGTPGPERPGW
jgi:hypothetical protein